MKSIPIIPESENSDVDSIEISKISKNVKSSSHKDKTEKKDKKDKAEKKEKKEKNEKKEKKNKKEDSKIISKEDSISSLSQQVREEKEHKEQKEKNEIKDEKPSDPTEKDIREKEIFDLGQMLLKKSLDGRRFYEERIKNWSQAIIDEMWTYLLEKYPKFGFGILVFILEEHEYFTAGQAIFNRELDSKIIVKYQSSNMSAILVVFFVKKRKRNVEVLYIDPEHFFNINRIFSVSLEKREWSNKYENCLVHAVNDINTYLIKDISLGKSFLQGFVLRNNYIRMHANFKFGNVEFLPYITSYTNDAVNSFLFCFFINN